MPNLLFIILFSSVLASKICPGMEKSLSGHGASEPFIQIAEMEDNHELQGAVKTYVSADNKLRVTLLSSVHIGELAFFDKQQQLMERADLVLYEGAEPATLLQHLKTSYWRASPQVRIAKAYGLF